jgi:hypothetical protein
VGGLIGPSGVAWSRGSKKLVDVPLSPVDLINNATDGMHLTALDETAHRIHLLGGQGTNTWTPHARNILFGELLGLCADCHTRVGGGP